MLVLALHDPIPDGLLQVAGALGIVPHECGDPLEARRIFSAVTPLIILLPAFLGDEPTLPFMLECMDRVPNIQTIMVVERHQINEAAEAMRAGVLDCLFRPFSRARFAKTLIAAMRRLGVQVTDDALVRAVQSPAPPGGQMAQPASDRRRVPIHTVRPEGGRRTAPGDACLLGDQPATVALRQAITAACEHRLPVLLTGEAGCGKSHCARRIHAWSAWADAPFVRLDCSALEPDALDEQMKNCASGTTFFLDEISDLSPQVQARLVRLIGEDGPPGARLISATAQDPTALIRDGRLRRDLFYRLCATEIAVPPLRARAGDVPAIAAGLLAEAAAQADSPLSRFSPTAQDALRRNPWPGNLRQLANMVKSLVLRHSPAGTTTVTPEMLPGMLSASATATATPPEPLATGDGTDLAALFRDQSLEQIERRIIEAIIRDHGGSVTRAARTLKVAPSTLYRKREIWTRKDSDQDPGKDR